MVEARGAMKKTLALTLALAACYPTSEKDPRKMGTAPTLRTPVATLAPPDAGTGTRVICGVVGGIVHYCDAGGGGGSLQKDCVSSSGDGGTNLTCVMASGTDAGTYTVAAPQVVNDGTYTNQLGPILTTDGGTMAWTLPPGASGLLDTYVMGQLYAADAGPNFGYSKWECGVGLLGNGCRFSSPCTAMQSWIASDAGFATGWTTTVSLASLDAGGCQERVSVSAPGYPVMWGGLSQFAGVPPWPSSLPHGRMP